MNGAIIILIILAVMGVIGLIGYLVWLSEKKRAESLKATAEQMGLVFVPDGDLQLMERLGAFAFFNQGHSRKLKNLISGETEEVRISIFDYKYTTGSGKNSHTHSHTLAALESARLANPVFSLRPENFFDKIGGMLGFQDIDFVEHPEFSEMFVLKGPVEEAIRAFFDKSLLDFLVRRPGIMVEALPGALIYYRSGRRKPDELPALLEEAYKVFGAIVDRGPTA